MPEERKEYPQREVYINGVYCRCQVLNPWEQDAPEYMHVNSLDQRRLGEWITHQSMGTWANVDLFLTVKKLNGQHHHTGLPFPVGSVVKFSEKHLKELPFPERLEFNRVEWYVVSNLNNYQLRAKSKATSGYNDEVHEHSALTLVSLPTERTFLELRESLSARAWSFGES